MSRPARLSTDTLVDDGEIAGEDLRHRNDILGDHQGFVSRNWWSWCRHGQDRCCEPLRQPSRERVVTLGRVVGSPICVVTTTERIVDSVSEQNRLQINWVNSAGGALGAVSSAVLLSSLGVAGTLVGAALGSLVITVGGAVYSHYLRKTGERVAERAGEARRAGRVRQPVPAEAGAGAHPADRRRPEDLDHTDQAKGGKSAGQLIQGLPWKRILGLSAALFGIAMALIVAFELATGRAVSTYTGGTSNTNVGTSIPGWSGTGQESSDVELDVPLPGEVEDGDGPQEAPQEELPQEELPQEEEAPQQEPPPQQPAPEDPAP